MIPTSDDIHIQRMLWLAESTEEELDEKIYKNNWRLIFVTLNGRIFEINQETLKIENIIESSGGPIWDIKYNRLNETVIVGCEDGSIKIFDISNKSINYIKSNVK